MKYVLFSAVLLGLLLAAPAAADHGEEAETEAVLQAEDVTISDLGVEDPGLLPTSRLYFFKEWGRGIQSFFTFNPIAKAELEARFTNEKAAELKAVEEQVGGNEDAIARALDNYQRAQERLRVRLERVRETSENPNVDRLLEQVTERTVLHEKLFEEIEERHADKGQVQERIRQQKKTFGQIMGRVAEKDAPEKFAERIREALEKTPGSAFKHIRSVEFLDDIAENVPEEARERLVGVREGLKERLKERIELEGEDGENLRAIFEQIPGDKGRRAVVLEEIRVRASDRTRGLLETVQGALEQKVVQAGDRKEKAAEQIERAEKRLQKAREKIAEAQEPRAAAQELVSEAERHLASAKESFAKEEYGEAFGQARAAEVASRNALRILEDGEEPDTNLERIKERIKERVRVPELLRALPSEVRQLGLVTCCLEGGTCTRQNARNCEAAGGTTVDANSCNPNPCKGASSVVCTQEYDPVCGVDGTTYSNRCVAERQNGVNVAYRGECEDRRSPEGTLRIEPENQQIQERERTQQDTDNSRQQRLERQLQEQIQQLDQLQKQLQDTQAE